MASYIVTVWLKKGGHTETFGLADTLAQAKKAFEFKKKDSNTFMVTISKVIEIHQNR